jgi:hypothetical protein
MILQARGDLAGKSGIMRLNTFRKISFVIIHAQFPRAVMAASGLFSELLTALRFIQPHYFLLGGMGLPDNIPVKLWPSGFFIPVATCMYQLVRH